MVSNLERPKKPKILAEAGPGRLIFLITPEQFNTLPDGTKLISIFGERVIKGRDDISLQVQDKYIAFGFAKADKPAGIEFNPESVWSLSEQHTSTPNQIIDMKPGADGSYEPSEPL